MSCDLPQNLGGVVKYGTTTLVDSSVVHIQFIRCLRHKDDWGALILIDERFALRAKTPEGLKVG